MQIAYYGATSIQRTYKQTHLIGQGDACCAYVMRTVILFGTLTGRKLLSHK